MSPQIEALDDRVPFGLSVGPGWFALIEELDTALIELLGPDYPIAQVKSKFAGLRYYLGGVAPVIL